MQFKEYDVRFGDHVDSQARTVVVRDSCHYDIYCIHPLALANRYVAPFAIYCLAAVVPSCRGDDGIMACSRTEK